MPGPVTTAPHQSVSRGDLFLMAERKNRQEKARLERQLRVFDRDCQRHEFHIEKQKRTIVSKWQTVALTTGHSEKALPPSGPKDSNVYDSSKHGQFRLSEKRLMEWKVRERQLEKFMKQYEPQPRQNRHGYRPKTTPISTAGETSKQDAAFEISGQDRVQSAASIRRDCHPSLHRRCLSASALTTSDVCCPHGTLYSTSKEAENGASCEQCRENATHPRLADVSEEEDPLQDGDVADMNGNKESGGHHSSLGHVSFSGVYDPKSEKHSPKKIHSGLRSMSAASFHDTVTDAQFKKRPSTATQNRKQSSYIGDHGRIPTPGELSKAQACEDLRSYTQDLRALQKTRHDSGTQFFITKSNVVMTNAFSQTCKQFVMKDAGIEEQDSGDEVTEENSLTPRSQEDLKTSQSNAFEENMSVSPVPSCHSDNADSVFGPVDETSNKGLVNCSKDVLHVTLNSEDLPDRGPEKMNSGFLGRSVSFEMEQTNPTVQEDCARAQNNSGPATENSEVEGDKKKQSQPKGTDIVKNKDTHQSRPSSTIGCKPDSGKRTSLTPDSGKHARLTPNSEKQTKLTSSSNKTQRRHTLAPAFGRTTSLKDLEDRCRRHSSVHTRPELNTEGTILSLLERRKLRSNATSLHTPDSPGTADSAQSTSTSNRKDVNLLNQRRPHTAMASHRQGESEPDSPNARAQMMMKRVPQYGPKVSPTRPQSHQGFSQTEVEQRNSNKSSDHNTPNHHLFRENSLHQRERRFSANNRGPTLTDRPRSISQSSNSNSNPSSPIAPSTHLSGGRFGARGATPSTEDSEADPAERPGTSQWRRDLAREQPPGLSHSVSSLGTVIKAAMVFSKAARRRALSSMVEEHNVDTREVIRKERLRVLQSRASVLNKIVSQFPVHGDQ